jgi:hypothetical protein
MEQQTKSLQKYYYYLIRQNVVDAERLDGIKNHYKKLCEEKISPAEKLRLDELYFQYRKETKRSYYEEKIDTNKIISKMKPDVMLTMTFDNNSYSDAFCRRRLEEFLKRLNKKIFGRWKEHELEVIPFRETNQNNGIHYHILMKNPSYLFDTKVIYFQQVCIKTLKKIYRIGYANLHNPEWYKKLSYKTLTEEDITNYVMKECQLRNDLPIVTDLMHYTK